MFAALDVYYTDSAAVAAAVLFERWDSDVPTHRYTIPIQACGDYTSGEFYLRELKPLLAVISAIRESVSLYVIDAYCQLSEEGHAGLGAHLHRCLNDGPSIIGVAKSRFRSSSHAVEVLRGGSRRPLFVTAIGMDCIQAASHVSSMHGPHRVPTLLKEVDRLSRTNCRTHS